MSKAGFPVYRSEQLEVCWTDGYSSVTDVTFESAAYVARYCMKKVSGKDADKHYLDLKTGVVREREYTTMSRGGRESKGLLGGIGGSWIEKYRSDCFPFGTKVVNGVECKTPRYYENFYEAVDPSGFARMKSRRNNLINVVENSISRLLVKEEVLLSKVNRLARSLEYDDAK